jgi:outer membrane protein
MLLRTNLRSRNCCLRVAAISLGIAQLCAAQTPQAQGQTAQQNPPTLTLQQAEALALQNHPQVQAAQNEINYANQQIIQTRSAYYPFITGDLTGSQANNAARIGAGDLTDSRVFNRAGQGIVIDQLITDSGRTSNLVASSRLQAQATTQNSQATRYDVLLQVNSAYYNVLHAQAVVKVAQETISFRQTLSDQIAELTKNQLKSQLDVAIAETNVSEAKLLLLRAQDAVQQGLAQLGRAMGSDQPANYRLADEPLPPGPPATADQLVAQAIANRPEFASLRYARDSAYKFADAEKDLSRPTVSATAVGGFLPYIDAAGIPAEYEAIGVNVSIPIFNGHQFAARSEAAHQHALESDQKLRDEQELISRDVRVAWANANDAFQRIDVTAQFLSQAGLALNLAHSRYDLGLSSIVELTQTQLSFTEAQIELLNAKYDYQIQNAALQYAMGLLR